MSVFWSTHEVIVELVELVEHENCGVELSVNCRLRVELLVNRLIMSCGVGSPPHPKVLAIFREA